MSNRKKSKYHSTFKSFKYTVMLFMVIPMLLLSVFIISGYSKSLHSELGQRRETAFKTVISDIEEQFNEISVMQRLFRYEGSLRTFLLLNEDDIDSLQKYNAGLETEKIYQAGTYSKKISIWSPRNNYVFSYENGVTGAKLQPGQAEPEWYKRYIAGGSMEMVYADGTNIVITKPLDDLYITKQTAGMLIAEYDKKQLAVDLDIERYGCDMSVRLYSESGDEVFSVGDVDISYAQERTMGLANAKTVVEFGKSDEAVISSKVNTYFIICILLCIVIAYIISWLCAKFLYKSVKNVFSGMGSKGEPLLGLAGKTDYIEDDKNRDTEEKLAKLLDKMQSMQLSSLQMQINPHFVFNVLNYVNLKIQRGDETKESQMIMLLSKILSYAMSEPKYSAKLVEEIKMTEKYIEIEKIKSNNAFDVEWNMDKRLLDRECIKLFLQPIVENSIMHGIKKLKDRRGKIIITVAEAVDGICFTIADNGVGMTEEELEAVRARLDAGYDDSSKHIGLKNVNERIKMVYGKNYGVSVKSDGDGTTVTIRIGNSRKEIL